MPTGISWALPKRTHSGQEIIRMLPYFVYSRIVGEHEAENLPRSVVTSLGVGWDCRLRPLPLPDHR